MSIYKLWQTVPNQHKTSQSPFDSKNKYKNHSTVSYFWDSSMFVLDFVFCNFITFKYNNSYILFSCYYDSLIHEQKNDHSGQKSQFFGLAYTFCWPSHQHSLEINHIHPKNK